MRNMRRPIHSIDSFKFVVDQIVDDLRGVFAGTHDVLAVLGAYYAAKKVYGAVSTVADAFYVHLLGRATNVDWVTNYGPWAGERDQT